MKILRGRPRPDLRLLTKALVAFSIVSLLALIALQFTARVELNKCDPPPDGFQTVYCGRRFMAVADIDTNSRLAVMTSTRDTFEQDHNVLQTWIDRTDHASFPYIETMVSILQKHKCRKVLLLGLGGGALPFFYSSVCPEVEMTAVDFSTDSIEIVKLFVMKDNNNKIKYVHDDAQRFLRTAPTTFYDAVVFDIYDGSQLVPFAFDEQFMDDIYRVLGFGGIYMMNLFSLEDRPDIKRAYDALSGVFKNAEVAELEFEPNVVLSAIKNDNPDESFELEMPGAVSKPVQTNVHLAGEMEIPGDFVEL